MKTYTFTIILIAALTISSFSKAQISIGKEIPADNAILDFGTDNNKGIVLPYVLALDAASVPGTLYYDANTSKVMLKGNTALVDLSVKSVSSGFEFNPTANGYGSKTEVATLNGVVIGAPDSTAPGVMVLESTTQALVLPNVTSYNNVGNPAPGTIVYDSTKNILCVFDGEKWAFWGRTL